MAKRKKANGVASLKKMLIWVSKKIEEEGKGVRFNLSIHGFPDKKGIEGREVVKRLEAVYHGNGWVRVSCVKKRGGHETRRGKEANMKKKYDLEEFFQKGKIIISKGDLRLLRASVCKVGVGKYDLVGIKGFSINGREYCAAMICRPYLDREERKEMRGILAEFVEEAYGGEKFIMAEFTGEGVISSKNIKVHRLQSFR